MGYGPVGEGEMRMPILIMLAESPYTIDELLAGLILVFNIKLSDSVTDSSLKESIERALTGLQEERFVSNSNGTWAATEQGVRHKESHDHLV